MAKHQKSRGIPLPRGWPRRVKSAMLNVIALAQYAATYTRGWAIDGRIARLRLKAENDQLRQEVALLTEEMRIKDARMKRVDPQKRPHYAPTERMAILELRAARAWSAQQTAETFLVTAATIASWMKRVDEDGADALVQIREPVNKFPDFVRYAVQRLKALCPTLGKAKIAETLCRAGLHLGTTTVGRILKESPRPAPSQAFESTERVVTAKHANHVWHIDLTTVPTGVGLWAPWMPFALPQCWPFCWWLAVVIDHHSRRAMGFSIFPTRPTIPPPGWLPLPQRYRPAIGVPPLVPQRYNVAGAGSRIRRLRCNRQGIERLPAVRGSDAGQTRTDIGQRHGRRVQAGEEICALHGEQSCSGHDHENPHPYEGRHALKLRLLYGPRSQLHRGEGMRVHQAKELRECETTQQQDADDFYAARGRAGHTAHEEEPEEDGL